MSYRIWLCAILFSACSVERTWRGDCTQGDEQVLVDLTVMDQDDLSSSLLGLAWRDPSTGSYVDEVGAEQSGTIDAQTLSLSATLEGGGPVLLEAERDGNGYRGTCSVEIGDLIMDGVLLLEPFSGKGFPLTGY